MKNIKRICIFVFAGIFVLIALSVHWSDSELWAIGLSKETFSLINPSVDYKFLFNTLLRTVYLFSDSNLTVVQYSRVLFAIIGLCHAFTVAGIAKATSKHTNADGYAWILLGASTLFLSQGFKVRSDVLACLLQFLGVAYFLHLVRKKEASEKIKGLELVIGIVFNVLILLATPKGLYNLLVSFVFILALNYKLHRGWVTGYLKFTFLAPAVLFLVLAGMRFSEFRTALDFLIYSYGDSPQHPAFWRLQSFIFVGDAALRNILIILLVVFGVLKYRNSSTNIYFWPAMMASLASVFVILIHNDRLPFFLLSHSIFPILLAVLVLSEIQSVRFKRVVLGSVVLGGAFYVTVLLSQASNKTQIETQATLQNYLKAHQSPTYYDATSALPLDNKIFIFPAPQHLGNEGEVLGVLNRKDLSLVFFGNRLFYYFQPFYLAMEENFFIRIGPDVFARSHVVRRTHVITEEEWKGVCAEIAPQKELYVYVGESFLTMKLVSGTPVSCQQLPKTVETDQPFIAFSAFEPLQFQSGLTFSRIFDHKPFF